MQAGEAHPASVGHLMLTHQLLASLLGCKPEDDTSIFERRTTPGARIRGALTRRADVLEHGVGPGLDKVVALRVAGARAGRAASGAAARRERASSGGRTR